MRKRKQNANESNEIVTIDREMAQERYSLGGDSVDKVAREAGAVIKIGRRKLYLVKAMDSYLESLAM